MVDMDPDEFVLLTTSHDTAESHFITGLLESHGIEAFADRSPVSGMSLGYAYELTLDIKIYVKRSDLKDANSILNYPERITDEDYKSRRDREREKRKYDKLLGIVYLLIFAFLFYVWHSFTPKSEGQQFFRYILLGFSIVPAYVSFLYLNRED